MNETRLNKIERKTPKKFPVKDVFHEWHAKTLEAMRIRKEVDTYLSPSTYWAQDPPMGVDRHPWYTFANFGFYYVDGKELSTENMQAPSEYVPEVLELYFRWLSVYEEINEIRAKAQSYFDGHKKKPPIGIGAGDWSRFYLAGLI